MRSMRVLYLMVAVLSVVLTAAFVVTQLITLSRNGEIIGDSYSFFEVVFAGGFLFLIAIHKAKQAKLQDEGGSSQDDTNP